ncbi:unnamed protein product [Lactuca saligna]|uniref:Uncharacterized protein n=1 Tax=Lactuca saligna TaxID=75948 RepID=A0AA35UWH3_LACSI|nr:unnamed protein product [Lactuca saligna]
MDTPEGGAGRKVGEEKEIGKEGLKKKILNEGDRWDTHFNGDEVEAFRFNSMVHYVGSLLDGTRFNSSLEWELPFKFKLRLGFFRHFGWIDGFGENGWDPPGGDECVVPPNTTIHHV